MRNSTVYHSSIRFITFIHLQYPKPKQCTIYTIVYAGLNVAKNYRCEMRLHSPGSRSSITWCGPVTSIDPYWDLDSLEYKFIMDMTAVKHFNNGKDYFGDHNKDKLGEYNIPLMVNLVKKTLDLDQSDCQGATAAAASSEVDDK
jgi:hypothetical protein